MKSNTRLILNIIAIVCFALGLEGLAHAEDDTASATTHDTVRTVNRVLKGTIIQVSEVKIEAKKSTEGTGVVAGAAAGSLIGSGGGYPGRGSLLGSLVGAVIGGVAGGIAGAAIGSQEGQDLIIQTDDGNIINITQANDEKVGKFAEGDNVLVIYKGEAARVIRSKLAPVTPAVTAASLSPAL